MYYVSKVTSFHAKPDNTYCVKKRIPAEDTISDTASWVIVCIISDNTANPKGVAEGLAEILNRERKLKLPI